MTDVLDDVHDVCTVSREMTGALFLCMAGTVRE